MENQYLIVGLGNPGREYANTRHNAGFMTVQRLADRWRAEWALQKKFKARVAKLDRESQRLIFCQPETYMNASGEAVGAVAKYYQVPPSRMLVVVDDADLPLGEIRLRANGSSGGHHGLESIEAHLGTREYARLRIGIGREPGAAREITDYVLGQFSRAEAQLVDKVLARAGEQIECWLREGIGKAMSRFNGPVEDLKNAKENKTKATNGSS
jgi:peptidyl-tRNA hydrolase, PTH1 family